ncbi:hypothetical protein [Janthinobacterium psychrotolerans]|uniref:Uncharacterized protein n=1 Tax=Janthinobacterium psychrotolerans TaxID=1747903 RepID=A0A1A7C7H8_9BURK|nr:hypothetical protein [Janthinobacterium psychrotolerans]OBV41672.1 hypothetical protein ASR47_10427 [Janthinobacterium psychrotolerans]
MRQKNASMGRPAEKSKRPATPHGRSLSPGYLAVIFGMLALSGCTTAPLAPVRVEIPVFTPCVKMEIPRPAYEFDKLPAMATDGEIILALARDWLQGRKYEDELEAVIAGCQ